MPTEPTNSRSGGKQVLKLAATMCRVVRLSAPAIRATYPSSTALLAVLSAAEALCTLLPAAQTEMEALDALSASEWQPASGATLPGSLPGV